MMSSFYVFHLLVSHVPLVALFLNALGVGVLVTSMFTQDRQMRQQRQTITQLRGYVTDCLRAQIAAYDQVDKLQERCSKLLARQQLVEKRGPDAQRIELATRMLKRGSVDTSTLLDLGLTNTEIKLLTRLHGVPETMRSASPEADGSPAPEEPVQSETAEESSKKASTPAVLATQAQVLAQLFQTQPVVD